jgi:hypothetical protein
VSGSTDAVPGAPHLRWVRGGEAEVSTLDGDRITLLSTTPSAPGSRPEGVLASGGAVRVKVARCRRQAGAAPPDAPDARFVLEGRLLDATRETRAEIQHLLDPPAR